MNRFKELRLKKGLTQEEFRKKFNTQFNRTYTAAAISQIENGKRLPETKALLDFADFYSVSLDYLLGREDKKPVSLLSEEQLRCLGVFDKLGELGKKDFWNYLDYLANYKYAGSSAATL